MKAMTTLCLLVIFTSTLAAAEAPVIAVAQRSMQTGKEQIALTFQGKNARLTLNSNFVQGAQAEARLGLLEAPVEEVLENEKTVLTGDLGRVMARKNAQEKMKAPEIPSGRSPHDTQWLLNGQSLERAPIERKHVERLLENAPNIIEWKPVDVVKATLTPDGMLNLAFEGKKAAGKAPQRLPLSQHCAERGEIGVPVRWACKIPGYGTAYLKPVR